MDDDIKMLLNDKYWPHWPVLPVVHRTEDKTGLILAHKQCRVYYGNLFDLPKDLSATPYVDYSSPEDLMAEWRVD